MYIIIFRVTLKTMQGGISENTTDNYKHILKNNSNTSKEEKKRKNRKTTKQK